MTILISILLLWLMIKTTGFLLCLCGKLLGAVLSIAGYLILGVILVTGFGLALVFVPILLVIGLITVCGWVLNI